MQESKLTSSSGVVERARADGQFDVRIDGTVQCCHIGSGLRRTGVTIHGGDRVKIRTEADGVFRGEITHVRAPLEPAERPPPRRTASLVTRAAPTLQPRDQKIDRSAHPGLLSGADRLPAAGDAVHCTGGAGTVLRVLGRTGNGSRLLEIRLPDAPRTSFFAAASNVLLEPVGGDVD